MYNYLLKKGEFIIIANWTESKQLSHNSRVHAAHIGDSSRVPGSDDQGAWCYRAT